MANPRDFQSPVAAFEDCEGEFELINKFLGRFFEARMGHSPFDVVAWHGNNRIIYSTLYLVTFIPDIISLLFC